MGALTLEYLLSRKDEKGLLPSNGVVIKTIVTSEIGRTIADYYGIGTINTLMITAIGIYHLRHLLYHTRTKNLPGCANSLPIKTPLNTIIVMWRSFLI
jgi:hypothetical protein